MMKMGNVSITQRLIIHPLKEKQLRKKKLRNMPTTLNRNFAQVRIMKHLR